MEKPTVLVVDHDLDVCELWFHVFVDVGHQVLIVLDPSWLQPLQPLLSNGQIDAAIVGAMPEDSCLAACQTIKSTEPTIPILLIAGIVEQATRPELKALSVEAIIVMPFQIEDVVERVQGLIR
jgi:CheY-like chemotaxis protein